jgi:hypothetical protein
VVFVVLFLLSLVRHTMSGSKRTPSP